MRKLSESIWSDIQDRSTGKTVRKEDEVNHLDREGLYDYLTYHYVRTNRFVGISTSAGFNTIDVPIIIKGGTYPVHFDFDTNEVSVQYVTLCLVNKLFSKASENFLLKIDPNDPPLKCFISPKDGSEVTNQFFIDVIDFFINNISDSEGRAIKRRVNESIWSDIQDRSSGKTVRKEDDDINSLDRDDLYDYLTSHYKNTNSSTPISNFSRFNIINVPVIFKSTVFSVHFDFNTNEVYTHCLALHTIKGLFIKMAEKFSLKDVSGDNKEIISPKDGSDVTNRFFIDVIDFIIDNIPNPNERGVKKIVNESIWSDIQDRSSGDVVRKEDDVNLLDRDGFYKYIMEHYKTATEDVTGPYAIINSKNADYINIPILENDNILFRVMIWHFDKDERYITIPAKKPFWGSDLFVKIRDTFKLQANTDNLNPLFKMFPKDDKKVDNKFFLEVIDFIIDNAEEPFEPLLTRI